MTCEKAEVFRDKVAYVINHMPMSDAAYVELINAVMEFDVAIKKPVDHDSQRV